MVKQKTEDRKAKQKTLQYLKKKQTGSVAGVRRIRKKAHGVSRFAAKTESEGFEEVTPDNEMEDMITQKFDVYDDVTPPPPRQPSKF